MKKITFSIMALALAAMMFTGCKKENAATQEPEKQAEKTAMTFYAVPQGGERTGLDGGLNSIWTEGDQIKIFSTLDREGSVFTLSEGAGSDFGTFNGEGVEAEAYAAAYPASLASSTDGGTIMFNLTGTQNYVADSYDTNTVPVVAYSSSTDLTFENTTGMLRLGIKNATGDVNIKSMTLIDNNCDSKLWGTFKITALSTTGLEYVEGGDNTITMNLGNGVALNADTYTYFYFCLPVGTLASGFTVNMVDADNNPITLECTATTMEFNIGKTREVIANFGRGEANATAVGGNVKWVQLWADGPKWAEYNVGSDATHEYNAYYTWGGNYKNGDGITWNDDHNQDEVPLSGNFDTATNLWGGSWRMPTNNELTAVINYINCNVIWISNYKCTGKNGMLCTGIGDYSGNSVFFPAAGVCNNGVVENDGSGAFYWSSTNDTSAAAYNMYSCSLYWFVSTDFRYRGMSVRAILAE
ncbi:MAG: hypothetical protein MJ009_02075 [Paludibacteraceae bacterium]|nr:hypothetical protein [Paludibacteraceae bacterium]